MLAGASACIAYCLTVSRTPRRDLQLQSSPFCLGQCGGTWPLVPCSVSTLIELRVAMEEMLSRLPAWDVDFSARLR